jgi:NADH dehydrogenase
VPCVRSSQLGLRLARLQAVVLEHLPGSLMSRDNLASMAKDSVCDGPFPGVFGVTPVALEAIAPDYLSPAAMRSRYDRYRAGSGR